MKKIMILVSFMLVVVSVSFSHTATYATYFCCIGETGKCFTTNSGPIVIWHVGILHPCGDTPCTKEECSGKTFTGDSDGIIESVAWLDEQSVGEGYLNILKHILIVLTTEEPDISNFLMTQ